VSNARQSGASSSRTDAILHDEMTAIETNADPVTE
jgi:hypothetical protein